MFRQPASRFARSPAFSRERGVSLILSFLALLILVVVIGSITIESTIARSIAQREVRHTQVEFAVRGALELAKAELMKSATEAKKATAVIASASPAAIEPLASPSEGKSFAEVVAELTESGALESSSPSASPAGDEAWDTLASSWARPMEFVLGEITVDVRIVDEERKLNILGLLSEDAGVRGRFRDRLQRLLDHFRGGTSLDVTTSEAATLARGIEAFLWGRDRGPLPVPRQTRRPSAGRGGLPEDDALVWSEARFGGTAATPTYPGTVDELAAVPGVTDGLLYATWSDGRWLPGLMDVLTVHTSLLLDENGLLSERERFVWPFQKRQKGWQEQELARQRARDQALEANARNGASGRVNIHTAPAAVLGSLLPSSSGAMSVIRLWESIRVPDDRSIEVVPASNWAGIEEACRRRIRLMPEERAAFDEMTSGESHVFTVYLRARQAGRAVSGQGWAWRTMVWRLDDAVGQKLQALTILPLHPWSYPLEPSL